MENYYWPDEPSLVQYFWHMAFLYAFISTPIKLIFFNKKESVSEENIKRDFKNLELFRMNFKRTSTLLFLFVTAASCLIYLNYWIHTRINSLNKMTKYKISIAWVFLQYLFLLLVYLPIIFLPKDVLRHIGDSFIGQISFLVIICIQLYIPFKLLKNLREFAKENTLQVVSGTKIN